ncbi:MAG TPA: hypothetical protein VG456_01205, partial [Candidatus Sulfopaludibacter sp.]|nr:hypothetical protein [Candidatus Sulfopaludibacter sp.]
MSPKSKNFPVQLAGGQAILSLNTGDKIWITMNGDDANPLFVFSSAPKPSVPKGATYFGPGIRDIAPALANHYTPYSGETIYLDGGAWVRGNIDVRGRSRVTIMGPGILSGDLWNAETVQASPTFDQMMGYAMITGDWGGTNATVQNITIVDSPVYNFHGGVHTATDVKLLSPWYFSTDGFQGVNSTDQSFAFLGDNVFFPAWAGIASDNINVTNSFAASTNNAVICGGYWGNTSNNQYHATVNNVDIRTYITDAWVPYGATLTPAVFQIWMDNAVSSNGYSNQTYSNIRIEGDLSVPLAMLKNMPYPWGGSAASYQQAMGNGYNLIFQN